MGRSVCSVRSVRGSCVVFHRQRSDKSNECVVTFAEPVWGGNSFSAPGSKKSGITGRTVFILLSWRPEHREAGNTSPTDTLLRRCRLSENPGLSLGLDIAE